MAVHSQKTRKERHREMAASKPTDPLGRFIEVVIGLLEELESVRRHTGFFARKESPVNKLKVR
jgi:hypothetical protein